MAIAQKPVEVRHRKNAKKVLTYEDVRIAARAGNAAFQKFVDIGVLVAGK